MKTGNQISRAQKVAKLVYQGKLKLEDAYKISIKFGTLVESFYQEILMSILSVIAQENAAIGLGYKFGLDYIKASAALFDVFATESNKVSTYLNRYSFEADSNFDQTRKFIDEHYDLLISGYAAWRDFYQQRKNSFQIIDDTLAYAIIADMDYVSKAAEDLSEEIDLWNDCKSLFEERNALFNSGISFPESIIEINNSYCKSKIERHLERIKHWSVITDKSYSEHEKALQQALDYIKEHK